MIRYMLDTNVCIDILRGKSESLLRKLENYNPEEFAISSFVFAELHFGVCKSSNPARNLEAVNEFCTPISILPFDSRSAEQYGKVRAHLEQIGKSIGLLDTLIAAHALAVESILITSNEQEFCRVSDLKVENWQK